MSRITDRSSLPTQWFKIKSPKEEKKKTVQLCAYKRIGYVKTDQSCWRIASASRWILGKLGNAFCITKHDAGYFTKRCLEVKNAHKFESLYVPQEIKMTISIERKTSLMQKEISPTLQSEIILNPVLQETTGHTQNSQNELTPRERPNEELSHEELPNVQLPEYSNENWLRLLKDSTQKRETILACIKQDKSLFRELNNKWLNDPQMALTAILTEDNDALVITALALIDPVASLSIMAIKAIEKTISDYSNSYQFAFVSDTLRSDPKFMKVAVQLNPLVYYYAIGDAYEDREVALEVLIHPSLGGHNYLPEMFQRDSDLLLTAITKNADALYAADDSLLNNPAFIEKALKFNPEAREVWEKVKKHGMLNSEKKSAKIAQNRDQLLKEISQGIYNKEVLREILRKNPDDRAIALAIVEYDKTLFKHVSVKFKEDPVIALAAITATGWFETNSSASNQWAFISPKLRNDRDFLLLAVKKNPFVLYFACQAQTEDREIAMEVLCDTGMLSVSAHKYVSPKLLNDTSFMLNAIKRHARAFHSVGTAIKTEKFIKEAILWNPEVEKFLNKN